MAIKKVLKTNHKPGTGEGKYVVYSKQFNELVDDLTDGTQDLDVNSVTTTGAATIGGNHTVGGTLGVTGATTLSSTLAVTGTSTLGGAVNYKRQVTDTGGEYATPVVLTEAQSGRILLVDDATGLQFTLPIITASNIGMHFTFLVTVTITSNAFTVTAGEAGDLYYGGVAILDFDAAYTAPQGAYHAPDGADDIILTMNGSTTGGVKGTKVTFTAIGEDAWFVDGLVYGNGVIATPFS